MRRALPDLVATVVLAVAATVLWVVSRHTVTVADPVDGRTGAVTQTVVDGRLLLLAAVCAGVALVCAARAVSAGSAGGR